MKKPLFLTLLLLAATILPAQQTDINEQLFTAVKNNDVKGAKECIENGADVNRCYKDLYTFPSFQDNNIYTDHLDSSDSTTVVIYLSVLHIAARKKDGAEMLKLLLESGANVNANTNRKITPLHFATLNENGFDIAKLLIEYGADVNALTVDFHIGNESWNEPYTYFDYTYPYYDGFSPMHFSAFNRNGVEIAKLLIGNGADVNIAGIEGYTTLHLATQNKNGIELIKLLIANGADVNAKHRFSGYTPLHLACKNENGLEVARLLIENGADVNAKDKNGYTPLHLACKNENGLEVARLLIANGADVNAKDENDCTPLHFACENEKGLKIARLLIENEADVNASDKDGWTPIHYAAQNENGVMIVELLIDKKVDVNKVVQSKIDYGPKLTPLGIACDNKNGIEIAQLLINNGADYYDEHLLSAVKNKDGLDLVKLLIDNGVDSRENNTLLHYACKNKNGLEIARLLIEKGADVNATADFGFPPIFFAVDSAKDTRVVELLISNGAEVNYKEQYSGLTPMHMACRNKNGLEIVKLLIENGADVNSELYETVGFEYPAAIVPLHFALLSKNYDIAKLLIESGADVDIRTFTEGMACGGFTPLHLALTSDSCIELTRLLIDKGADVNAKTSDYSQYYAGCTPLHLAAYSKKGFDYAKLLIEKGADVNAKDNDNETPLHIASRNENILEIAHLLIENGADVNAKDEDDWTPLHLALYYANYEIARLLIEKGADMYAKNEYNKTPLHYAAENENGFEIAKLLIENGADVYAKDNDGDTPLHFACKNENGLEIVGFLIENGADVNAKDDDGYTPLHFASYNENGFEIARLMIEKGAEVNVKISATGYTALHIALINGCCKIAKLLIASGADLEEKTSEMDENYPEFSVLHFAILKGDMEIFDKLIESGVDINVMNFNKETPLHLASKKIDGYKYVGALLKNGAVVNVADNNGNTPLHYAAYNVNGFEIVKLLIENGSEVNSLNKNGESPLGVSFKNRNFKTAMLLFENSANANIKSTDEEIPLNITIKYHKTELAKLLINNGADVNAKTSEGHFYASYPLLHFAIIYDDLETARLLIENGADLNAKDESGRPPLHFALDNWNYEIARLLIEKGADVNAKSEYGYPPLHYASGNVNGLEIVRLLIEKGADVNAKTDYGYTPLHKACENENGLEIVRLLIEQGANVNAKDEYGSTPLHKACENENGLEIARLLIEQGANVNAKDEDDYTPLHFACENENGLEIARLLIEKGADVNAKDEYDNTPLLIAAKRENSLEITNILIANSASINEKNKYGNTALQYAFRNRNVELIQTLFNNGANLTSKSKDGNTMLHYACSINDIELVKLCVDNGVDVNKKIVTDNYSKWEKETALNIAVENNNIEIVNFLFENGAKANVKNSFPPLITAIENNNIEIAEILLENGANPNSMGYDRRFALENVMYLSTIEMAELLISYGANVNVIGRDSYHETDLLASALLQNNTKYAKLFINNGANVNFRFSNKSLNYSGFNLLHFMIKEYEYYSIPIEMFELLIDSGVDINAIVSSKNKQRKHYFNCYKGYTALHFALSIDFNDGNVPINIVQLLLNRGANVNIKASNGVTPLHLALARVEYQEECKSIVSSLIDKGADVNARVSDEADYDSGYTPLHFAVIYKGASDLIVPLIEAGADVNKKDAEACTPLHYAVANKDREIVTLLLENGADLNTINKEGNTPLHVSVMHGSKQTVALLCLSGANTKLTNAEGKLPVELAHNHDYKNIELFLSDIKYQIFGYYWLNDTAKIMKILNESPELACISDTYGKTLWHWAIRDNNTKVLDLLLKYADCFDQADFSGETPLMLAIRKHNEIVANTLIDKGADINAVDNNGHSAFYWAKRNREEGICMQLYELNVDTIVQLVPELKVVSTNSYIDRAHFYSSKNLLKLNTDWNRENTGFKLIDIFNGNTLNTDRNEYSLYQDIYYDNHGNIGNENYCLIDSFTKDTIIELDEEIIGLSYNPRANLVVYTTQGILGKKLIIRDTETGKKLFTKRKYENYTYSSSQSLLKIYETKNTLIFNTDKFKRILKVSSHYSIQDVSNYGTYLGFDEYQRRYNYIYSFPEHLYVSGKNLEDRIFSGHNSWITNASFSPNGNHILSASLDSTAKLWDVTTTDAITFRGHKAGVLDAAFLEDTSRIVSVDATGVIIYWDVNTQERIITLYPVTSTEYVAVTPDGYFDGSEEALKYLYYQQGDKTIPLTAYYEEFYQPNLAQRILNNESIEKSRVDFNKRKPNAGVNITEPSGEDYRTINMPIPSDANILHLEAEFTDNGGGIDEVRVFRNDKLVRSEKNLGINEPCTVLNKAYDIELLPGINTIRVSVFNTDRTEISDTVKMNFTGTITEASELYVISIGINEYKNPQYHLSYAVNDALAFSECLEKGAQTLFGDIHTYRITDRDATKSQISATIEEIQQMAKPWDVFVFYYAGHGAAVGEGSKKDFYFIPYDVTNIYSAEQLQDKAISNNELLEYSRDIQAEKQFIIVDACNSGAAGQALAFRNGPEEEKAIAILARSTGTHFLFASTADQLAKEIPEIGHGVMTYAILDAMSGGGGEFATGEGISVKEISLYTEKRVPVFSELYTPNKVAQYPIVCSFGQDFPLILPGEHINIKKLKGKYDDYSIEELEEMKMHAIEEEDYRKAAEIKDEIDKRNK